MMKTEKQDKYLESKKNFGDGIIYTYLSFNGDTTGQIQLVYKVHEKTMWEYTIAEQKSFRVAFEGEYTEQYPMLGSAEFECLERISNRLNNKK